MIWIYLSAFHLISSLFWAIALGYYISKEEKYLELKKDSDMVFTVLLAVVIFQTFLNLFGAWLFLVIQALQGNFQRGHTRTFYELVGIIDFTLKHK